MCATHCALIALKARGTCVSRVVRTHATGAVVGAGAEVGPFTYLRPGTRLGASSKAGAFVEIKASEVGEGSKVPHLSYVGDATIGTGSSQTGQYIRTFINLGFNEDLSGRIVWDGAVLDLRRTLRDHHHVHDPTAIVLAPALADHQSFHETRQDLVVAGLKAGDVVITAGSSGSVAMLSLALVDPGDVVLVPDPGYPVYAVGTKFAGGHNIKFGGEYRRNFLDYAQPGYPERV